MPAATGGRAGAVGALTAARSGPLRVAFALAAALALGAAVGTASSVSFDVAVAACFLPAVPLLLLRPRWAALLAVAVLPLQVNVVGAGLAGVNVAPADLLLSLAMAGVLLSLTRDRALRRALDVLRPFTLPIGAYFLVGAVSIAAHPSGHAVLAYLQRVEVVVVALLVGAFLLVGEFGRRALLCFVVGGVVLAVLWTVGGGQPELLAGQKNPAGQAISDAALVALALVPGNWRYVLFAFLGLGAYATESRGALLGLGVGVIVLAGLSARDLLDFLVRGAAIAVVIVVGFLLLPPGTQQRILGNTDSTRYNDDIRRSYAADARVVIDDNPYVGVGIGNYFAGDQYDLTATDDPHEVVLLTAAEGGYPLLVAFGVMQVGAMLVVFRRRKGNALAPIAIAVQVATLVHALVDIYWVRGTPVLGWVLLGAAAVALGRSERVQPPDPARPSDRVVPALRGTPS